jgi:hypothetical protein
MARHSGLRARLVIKTQHVINNHFNQTCYLEGEVYSNHVLTASHSSLQAAQETNYYTTHYSRHKSTLHKATSNTDLCFFGSMQQVILETSCNRRRLSPSSQPGSKYYAFTKYRCIKAFAPPCLPLQQQR